MKENLIKCIVRTSSGLTVECELTPEAIKELKTKKLATVHKIK